MGSAVKEERNKKDEKDKIRDHSEDIIKYTSPTPSLLPSPPSPSSLPPFPFSLLTPKLEPHDYPLLHALFVTWYVRPSFILLYVSFLSFSYFSIFSFCFCVTLFLFDILFLFIFVNAGEISARMALTL